MRNHRRNAEMIVNGINFDEVALAEFCRRYGIARMWLFGSILRPSFRDNSDVDVLVRFEPHCRVSLLGLAGMSIELQEMLGREVDLRTPEDLSQYFRDDVLNSARPLYAA